jgi:hypothetical protein
MTASAVTGNMVHQSTAGHDVKELDATADTSHGDAIFTGNFKYTLLMGIPTGVVPTLA